MFVGSLARPNGKCCKVGVALGRLALLQSSRYGAVPAYSEESLYSGREHLRIIPRVE